MKIQTFNFSCQQFILNTFEQTFKITFVVYFLGNIYKRLFQKLTKRPTVIFLANLQFLNSGKNCISIEGKRLDDKHGRRNLRIKGVKNLDSVFFVIFVEEKF